MNIDHNQSGPEAICTMRRKKWYEGEPAKPQRFLCGVLQLRTRRMIMMFIGSENKIPGSWQGRQASRVRRARFHGPQAYNDWLIAHRNL